MEFGTEMLDEDGLFDLIRRLPGKKSKYQIAAENERSQVGSTLKMLNAFYFVFMQISYPLLPCHVLFVDSIGYVDVDCKSRLLTVCFLIRVIRVL